MKKLLLTAVLVAATTAAFAQGTFQFSNNTLSRLSTAQTTDGLTAVAGTSATVPFTAGLNYGFLYGTGAALPATLTFGSQLGISSTSSLGIIASPADGRTTMTAVQIPGTLPGQADVWVQIVAWSGAANENGMLAAKADFLSGKAGVFWGANAPQNLNALGPATGPGVASWEGAVGTNARLLNAFTVLTFVPEPSSMALLGLGAAALMIFRRRQ